MGRMASIPILALSLRFITEMVTEHPRFINYGDGDEALGERAVTSRSIRYYVGKINEVHKYYNLISAEDGFLLSYLSK